jgi:NADPH:quinone reductase
MKAIRCREWGIPGVLRLEDAESPRLEPHQVRIRVRAAGVNFADSLMVGGTYQVKPPFPFTPGLEAAGEIVETGSAVDGLQAGSGCSRFCATVAATPRKSRSMPPQWCRSRMR